MESYNAHINQNAYNPETRVIEKAQEVKVGQWWKWKEGYVTRYGTNDPFLITEIGGYAYYKYQNGRETLNTWQTIAKNARLIMCPSWPIEVGDRFEAERHFQSNGQEWKTETVVCRVIYIDNNSTALVESESDYYNEEDILTLESLGKMRRLPRQDKPKGKRSDPNHVSQSDYHTGNDHVRDATEKVEPQPAIIYVADTEELYQKAGDVYPHECWSSRIWRLWIEDNKTLILGNPEPVKAMQKQIKELEIELDEYRTRMIDKQIKESNVLYEIRKVFEPVPGKLMQDELVTLIYNTLADLRGERDSAMRRALQAENKLRGIVKLNKRIAKITNTKGPTLRPKAEAADEQ